MSKDITPTKIPHYIPRFLWNFWLSKIGPGNEPRDPRLHIYDIYENELSEIRVPPDCHRPIFQDLDPGQLDPETKNVIDMATKAFADLEQAAEQAAQDILSNAEWSGERKKKPIPLDRKSVEALRTYFVFVRFRNSAGYHKAVESVEKNAQASPQDGTIYSAYRPVMTQIRRRYVLRTFTEFLRHSSQDKTTRNRSKTGGGNRSDAFQEAMELYCWRLCDAEVCLGVATEEQEFMFADCCFGTLDEGFEEDPECCDIFFPIFPTLAIYILGTADEHYSSASTYRQTSRSTVWIDTGLESASDVHLRNAMVLQTYPNKLYFSSLRTVALSVSSYDEFRWIQEHQDYSRLKMRCRQKFLQETVTKTLVVKGEVVLTDLTEEIEKLGDEPVSHGSFSDVWKGIWYDPVERRKKVVALKFLRQVMVKNVKEKLVKRLQAEVLAWHHLCHRNISQLYGIIQSSNSFAMVSPWCDNDTMCHYIKVNPGVNRLKLLIQVASGIAYLHAFKPTVVHGDLKGGNILIDDKGYAIITDFGLSKVMEEMSDRMGTSFFAGSTRWMAPELIQTLVEDADHAPPITTYSDVYAFASVCLEVDTGQLPYPHRTNDYAVMVDIMRGIKPSRGASCHIQVKCEEAFWAKLDECWTEAYTLRPTMKHMLEFLESMDISKK